MNELEIHYHCFNDIEVEIHYKPFVMDSPKDRLHQKYFNRSLEANYKNTILLSSDYAITAPTFSFNIVHQLVHIHHHLFYEGVGLRQCMDYYFVLRNLNLDLNVNHNTNATFRSFGMERFAEAAMWIMQQVFGLKPEYLLCEPSEKYGRVLLNEVIRSGNFGHQDERVKRRQNESAIHRFWRIGVYNCRVMSFSPWTVICSPLWRLWHWCWRKKNGYR